VRANRDEQGGSPCAVRSRGGVLHHLSAAPARRERAYRDTLKLLFGFAAERRGHAVASLELDDLDADLIASFLDHLETSRSNSAATRNCRRAAIRSFFKHLLRNDLDRSRQYTKVLALPSKKARQRPATYLEAADVRAIIANPDRRTLDGWRDYALLLFLYNCGARVSEVTGVLWDDLQLTPPATGAPARQRPEGTAGAALARDSRCVAPASRHAGGPRSPARLCEPSRPAPDP
jgi:integrase